LPCSAIIFLFIFVFNSASSATTTSTEGSGDDDADAIATTADAREPRDALAADLDRRAGAFDAPAGTTAPTPRDAGMDVCARGDASNTGRKCLGSADTDSATQRLEGNKE
jgi:hypothetical protein